MYVCLYVRMHVYICMYIYICMYACMHVDYVCSMHKMSSIAFNNTIINRGKKGLKVHYRDKNEG